MFYKKRASKNQKKKKKKTYIHTKQEMTFLFSSEIKLLKQISQHFDLNNRMTPNYLNNGSLLKQFSVVLANKKLTEIELNEIIDEIINEKDSYKIPFQAILQAKTLFKKICIDSSEYLPPINKTRIRSSTR